MTAVDLAHELAFKTDQSFARDPLNDCSHLKEVQRTRQPAGNEAAQLTGPAAQL
jgi:hypothetical protein